jgi:hypothetical protein
MYATCAVSDAASETGAGATVVRWPRKNVNEKQQAFTGFLRG